MKKEKFSISGMSCAACQANITKKVSKINGVKSTNVNLMTGEMETVFDESTTNPQQIIKTVKSIGYSADLLFSESKKAEYDEYTSAILKRKEKAITEQKNIKLRLIFSAVLLIPLMYISMGHMLKLPLPAFAQTQKNLLINALIQLFITLIIVAVNKKFYISGTKAFIKRAPNMDTLIAVGSGASLLYGIFVIFRIAYAMGNGDMSIISHYSHELYFESCAMILTLVTLGKFLESVSKAKTTSSLEKLLDLKAETARVFENGEEIIKPAKELKSGDIIVIKPGESIPVDGIITQGFGYIDQSAITGESIPTQKQTGDEVISATINKNGSFLFKATQVGSETTLSKIIKLVDEASNSKAPIASLADKISAVFVPVVMCIALVTGIVWLIINRGNFEFALSCAISVLVISCPCALGLATPVAIMVGTGKAAQYSVLIKSAESLETLHSVDTVVLDKTGTITYGKPTVTDIIINEKITNKEDFLLNAITLESKSEHPLAQAVNIYISSKNIKPIESQCFNAVAGKGVSAEIMGEMCYAGNSSFIKDNGIKTDFSAFNAQKLIYELAQQGKTPLIFAKNNCVTGIIAVADEIKQTSISAINEFKKRKLKVVMLTGDNNITAKAIQKKLKIEQVFSEVLPTQTQVKETVQSWQKNLGTSFAAKIQAESLSDVLENVDNKNYTVAIFPLTADSYAAKDFLKQLSATGNVFGYSSTQYNSFLSGSNVNTSACKKAEQYIASADAVLMPIYKSKTYYACAQGVSGIYFSPFNGSVSFVNAVKV